MSLNDVSMHPTGVQGAYPGVQNPSTSSTLKASDAFAQEGDLSGHEQPKKAEPVRDVVEGAPGVIESAELAPLGEDKVAADPPTTLLDQASGAATSIATQASGLAKQAYDAVVGEK